jgi:hypothetical protein
MSKKYPSIAEARELLKSAIEANKHELIASLREVRTQLEELVSLVGPKELPREVYRELDALVDLRGQISSCESVSGYVRNSDKIEFIRDQLAQRGGQIPKAELLEAARTEWKGRNVSPQFLDRAIEEAFAVRKEPNLTITVLGKE